MSVLFAGTIVVLVGLIGTAIDLGRANALHMRMQAVLDAAVLAGASAIDGDRVEIARESFGANLEHGELTQIEVRIASPVAGEVTGTAVATIRTTFLSVLGSPEIVLSVSATAVTASPASPVCLLVLDSGAPQGLLVNSGASITAPDCEFHAHSTASPAAIFNAGTSLDTKRNCLKGTSIIDNGGHHPTLETDCDAAADPYAGTLPDPTIAGCDYTNQNFNGGSVTLSPGVYCGTFNFNAAPDVTLQPGLYVIQGGAWNVNGGDWQGDEVTFYFPDASRIQFNSAVSATLTSPESGAYKGILMFEQSGLARSPFVFDDSLGFNMEGLIYLPSRDVIFNSNGNVTARSMVLVVSTMIFNDVRWTWAPSEMASLASAGFATVRLK